MTEPFKTYIQSLQAHLARGNASEHTHRPALKTLLESLGERLTATNEPRQVIECGKPDMAIYQGPVLFGYVDNSRRVYINSEQYFEGIPSDVWAFTLGGYQVLHKWLKDRKGRTLSFDDLQHYQKVVTALAETIRLMGEIDAIIEAHGGWPIDGPPHGLSGI